MANWKPFYKYNTSQYTRDTNSKQRNTKHIPRKKGQKMTAEEIRKKRSNAKENYEKAKAFVRNKEAEIADLKDRLINACTDLDSDAYLSVMKQISERETELTALKNIADRTAEMIDLI